MTPTGARPHLRRVRTWIVLLLLPAPALAATGRVWSGDQPAARAAVLLDPLDPPATAAPGSARLEEVWTSFVPKVQVVAPGSTLLLHDRDDESHTVHAWLGGRTLFNRASAPRGEDERLVLDRPGIVTVTCDLHAEMRAFVVVSSARFVAVSDLDGRFRVDAPPGRYRARVWRPGAGDGDTPEPGRALGVVELGAATSEEALALRLPAQEHANADANTNVDANVNVKANADTNAGAAPRLPAWMLRLSERRPWPSGNWALALSIAGVPVGFLLAWLVFIAVSRARGSLATALMLGCGLAFLLGALVAVGLAGAVATALGFGAFMGTVLFGAHRLTTAR
jgi:plastocyanin